MITVDTGLLVYSHRTREAESCCGDESAPVTGNVIGGRIHDARIAALCVYHGVRELWTADRDFSMFPQLKTRNPLVKM